MTPDPDRRGSPAGPDRRTYGDACAAARALDVIGERWALLIVRELLFGPKRFTDLQSGLVTVNPSVLAQRLRELEGSEVIRRRKLGPPAPVWVYELTDWGRQLEPILLLLGQWGRNVPFVLDDAHLSIDALMLAVKSHFDPAKAPGLNATYLVALDADHFGVQVDRGDLAITRGDPRDPDAAVYTDPATFKALIIDGQPLSQAQQDGRVTLTGDTEALLELLDALH